MGVACPGVALGVLAMATIAAAAAAAAAVKERVAAATAAAAVKEMVAAATAAASSEVGIGSYRPALPYHTSSTGARGRSC